jgi:anti-sigma factor RsiW
MNCRDVIGFLMDYIDGVLESAERTEFEKHISICHSCVAYIKTYQQTIKMEIASRIEDVTIPEELVRAIMASRKL